MSQDEPTYICITQRDEDTDAEWSAKSRNSPLLAEADTLEELRAKLPGLVRELGRDPANMHIVTFRFSTPDDPMYSEGPQSYSPHWARPFRPSKVAKQPDEQPPQQKPPTKKDR